VGGEREVAEAWAEAKDAGDGHGVPGRA
jgi:hypothetical protein